MPIDGSDFEKCDLFTYRHANKIKNNWAGETAPTSPATGLTWWNGSSKQINVFDGADWQDSWDSVAQNDILPLAVEVTIELPPEAGAPEDQAEYAASRVFPIPCSSLQPGVSPAMQAALEGSR